MRRAFFSLWYLFSKPPWDTGIPAPELVRAIANRPPGRALDLGCGTGTNVRYLAEHGWQATGLDFAPSAIAQARRTCGSHANGRIEPDSLARVYRQRLPASTCPPLPPRWGGGQGGGPRVEVSS